MELKGLGSSSSSVLRQFMRIFTTHLSQVSHTHTCCARHAAAARMVGRCRLNLSKETELCEIILDESILMTGGT